MELTPDAVVAALGDGFGERLAGRTGWRLAEAHATGGDAVALRLEGEGGARLVVEVARSVDRDEAYVRAGGLAVSHWAAEGGGDVGEACRLVAAALAEGEAVEWTLPGVASWDPTPDEAIGPRVDVRDLGAEAAQLLPLAGAYRHHLGVELVARRLASAAGPAHVLTFPPDGVVGATLLRAPDRWRERPALRAHLEGLGFSWDGEGVLRTVPTPATFEALRDRSVGFAARLVALPTAVVSPGAWLRWFAAGTLPVGVPTRGACLAMRLVRTGPLRRVGWLRATLGSHLNAVGHDMGLHALPCSLVPAEAIARWGRRAAAALDPLITTRRPFAPEPLLAFYEEDLATVCRDAWSEASNVVEARAATAAAVPGLDRRLERRIEELRDRARARVCWPSRA